MTHLINATAPNIVTGNYMPLEIYYPYLCKPVVGILINESIIQLINHSCVLTAHVSADGIFVFISSLSTALETLKNITLTTKVKGNEKSHPHIYEYWTRYR